MNRTLNKTVFLSIFIFLSAAFLAADTEETELEKNGDSIWRDSNAVEKNEATEGVKEIGNLLLEPVAVLKKDAEEKIFQNRITITHDELNKNVYRKAEGPKLRISF